MSSAKKRAGMRSARERGAYGNARGKERQRRRAERRAANPRVSSALAEAREHQRQIDAAVARAAATASGPGRPVLRYIRPSLDPGTPSAPGRPSTPRRVAVSWTLADAIRLLRAGYRAEYVAKRTGYGRDIIDGLEIDHVDDEPAAATG